MPVIASVANTMTNKYAEGRPNKRYYSGCEHVDAVENLAIKELVNCFHALCNVQPTCMPRPMLLFF